MIVYTCLIVGLYFQKRAGVSPEVPTHKLVVDEEFLPFKDKSLDVVVSSLR